MFQDRLVTKLTFVSSVIMLIAALAPPTVAGAEPATKAGAVELKLDSSMAMVLATNRNGLPAKTRIIATEPFLEYYLTPVVDGIKQRADLSWQEAAWASAEDETPHGIEIQLSRPQRGGRFQITWAYDANGEEKIPWYASRDYVIQLKDKAADAWETVAEVKGNRSVIGSHPLPDKPFSFLRIYQLAGGGHPARPNLMWVGQIELIT